MSEKKVVFTWVLQGCPRKRLCLQWFYKVVRGKCCFYIGFTKVVREKPYKACIKTTFCVDNPPGMVSGPKDANCPYNSPSYTIESSLARPHSFASPRPLARTNETKRFPGWRFHKRTHPPNLQYIPYIHCFFSVGSWGYSAHRRVHEADGPATGRSCAPRPWHPTRASPVTKSNRLCGC